MASVYRAYGISRGMYAAKLEYYPPQVPLPFRGGGQGERVALQRLEDGRDALATADAERRRAVAQPIAP